MSVEGSSNHATHTHVETVAPNPPFLSVHPTLTLPQLPDDVLLRIIAYTGEDTAAQLGVAYRLAAVNSRLRRLIRTQFLTSLTDFSPKCLKSLCLSDAYAAHTALVSLFTSTTALRVLNLSGCTPTLISKGAMTRIATTASHQLTHLNLAYCRISDDVLEPLLSCCTALKKIVLVSCDGPTGAVFHKNICKAPIEMLDLSYVQTLTWEGLMAIGTLSTVSNLSLKGCDTISSNALHILNYSNIRLSLTGITLSYCPVRDSALNDLLKNAPKLRTLILAEHTANLWSTGEFTAAGIRKLRELYPLVNIRFLT